jgi:hypothetical protein
MRRRGLQHRSLVAAFVAALAITAAGVHSASAAVTADGTWTGTWAASPQSSDTTFNRQTLRQIVRTSIGGTSARIQLSNAFGDQPLVVDDVHVARRTSGSSVDVGTDRAVTFGGQRSVTIPAGSLAVSDAVAITVPAQSDLAVSIYLPQPTGRATFHQTGLQTNYVASDDVSSSASLSSPQQVGSYYFLANVDVQNTSAQGAVVTLGASITDGVGSSGDNNRRWPNLLAARLAESGRTVGVLNQGISGNRLLADGAGQSAANRFERDVLNQPGAHWVIFSDDPINDLISVSPPPSGTTLINAVKPLLERAHDHGTMFICSTLTPFKGWAAWSQAGEDARVAYNVFVRGAGSGCDAVLDQDAATRDPANPQTIRPAYDSGDHLHTNEAGLQAIANAVDLNWFGQGHPVSTTISLRSRANGLYVTAPSNGPLIASKTTAGIAEQFERVDAGNGYIALRSKANSQFVTAENAGAEPLTANRPTAGFWERLQLIKNPDGTVSFKTQVNGKYVCAENAGAQPLIANRDAIGPWESFDLVPS